MRKTPGYPSEGPAFETGGEQSENRFGRDVSLTIEFARHEDPGKNPDGTSADFLTETGQQQATKRGEKYEGETIKAYASPKMRAQQTVDLAIEGATEHGAKIINQTLTERLRNKTEGQKPENHFNIRLRKELDAVANFGKMMPEAKTWAKQQKEAGRGGSETDLIIQYYLNNPDRCKEVGVTLPEEAAEQTAFAASRELGMTTRLYSGSEVRLINVTHGPKLEPFLQRVMIAKDGKRGFANLEEIGGSFNPGESFEFVSRTDSDGTQSTVLLFRGKEYNVDLEELERLAKSYKEKLEVKKES